MDLTQLQESIAVIKSHLPKSNREYKRVLIRKELRNIAETAHNLKNELKLQYPVKPRIKK